MLVLSRKTGERVVIGQQVEVTVLKVRGNRVKLGVTGPGEMPIHRGEVHDRLAALVTVPHCQEPATTLPERGSASP